MIKRKIYKTLKLWKNDKVHKPILLRGARQVGKSYLIEQFGQSEFSNIITLNFERDPKYKSVFSSYDPVKIVEKIILVTAQEIKPGKTLLFLDEIQECPQAIVALRYFYEEMPDLHVIGAGSLLEFALQLKEYKVPVGRIQYLYLKPLSFREFLDAMEESVLAKYIMEIGNIKEIPDILHEKLLDLIRKYFILGGMPEVVNEYIESGDLIKCQNIQRSIIDTYEDDFGKYSLKSNIKNVKKVFQAAASMIGQKFVYASVDNTVKSRELKEAVDLLETAGVLTRIKRSNGDGLPLEANVKENYFKLLFLDIGLLHNMNGIYGETMLQEDLASVFRGAVAEQFVGQELLVLQSPLTKAKLYYWAREAKNSSAEIDYLIAIKGKVIPIEVKSGKTNKMISLRLFMQQYQSSIGIKISQQEYMEKDDILAIPFYGMPVLFTELYE
jgi:predicted AAA+ superfamily ATPase